MPHLLVDGHEDIATELLETGRDFASPAPPGHALSLPDLRRAGMGVVLATVFSPDGYWKGETGAENAARQMALYRGLFERHAPDWFPLLRRGDLARVRAGGPIGVLHLMEGADPIASPDDVPRWVAQGVRFVGIAWNTPNRWSGGTRDDHGLTPDGFALLDALLAAGVVPDLSHLNLRAVDDVLGRHAGVVVASHSNCHALRAHRRNLSDAQIRAIGARGGLVGVVLYAPFLGEGEVTLDTVLAHVDRIVSIAGVDAVGLGSDLDGGFRTDKAPKGIESVADLRKLEDALARHGYDDRTVGKVLGGNWLRVIEAALPA